MAYSLGVADVLQSYFNKTDGGRRWAALPDHRAEVDAVALEDCVQSGLALQAERATVKR